MVSLEQTDDSLRLPRGHVVVGNDLTSLQVALSVDDKCPAPAIQYLPTNEVGGIAIAKLNPTPVILSRRDVVPVDWRIARDNAQPPGFAQRRIDRAHSADQFLFLNSEAAVRHGVVLPSPSQDRSLNVVAADKSVDSVLVARARRLDDDVIHRFRETGIANEREKKRLNLYVAVWIGQRHDVVCTKRLDDRGDGIYRSLQV